MDSLDVGVTSVPRAALVPERTPPAGPSDTARPASPVLGRIGTLEVRLAADAREIRAAQALRYRVFFEEMGARPTASQRLRRLDRDRFDRHCEHLLVLDRSIDAPPCGQLVGTYRLMRREGARAAGGFYSEDEFDVGALLATHGGRRFLEVGRSCVLAPHRGRRTAELLWQGIWAYVVRHRIDVLFGCASLPGTDLDALAPVLAHLRAAALAPPEWRAGARADRGAPLPVQAPAIEPRRVLASLPPMLKGYLRLGAYIGDGAVVDRRFGTTDVLIVLPVERISARYVGYYGADARRFAA